MFFRAEDSFCEDPRPTPLYRAIAEQSEANSWTSVNGCAAARVFTSAADEYEAAREACVIVDFGALRRITVRGPDAKAFLARLASTPVHDLGDQESARGLLLNDEGRVVDFADATRLSADFYMLTTCAPLHRRMQLATRGFDVEVHDVSDKVAALALIGPAARNAAQAAGFDLSSDETLRQGRVRGVEAAIRPVHVGATPGVEIIFPHDEGLTLFDRVRRASRAPLAGLDALDILRIEGGTPRLGADFASADSTQGKGARTPEEIGLPHLAPPNRGWFSGRRAMTGAPPQRALVSLAIDADEIAPGAAVFAGDAPVGRITSSGFSPHLRRVVAFADIAAGASSKPLAAAASGENARVAASPLDTPESAAAAAWRAAGRAATDSGRWRVS